MYSDAFVCPLGEGVGDPLPPLDKDPPPDRGPLDRDPFSTDI